MPDAGSDGTERMRLIREDISRRVKLLTHELQPTGGAEYGVVTSPTRLRGNI